MGLQWENSLIAYRRLSTLSISLMLIPTIRSSLWEHLLTVKQIYRELYKVVLIATSAAFKTIKWYGFQYL